MSFVLLAHAPLTKKRIAEKITPTGFKMPSLFLLGATDQVAVMTVTAGLNKLIRHQDATTVQAVTRLRGGNICTGLLSCD